MMMSETTVAYKQ